MAYSFHNNEDYKDEITADFKEKAKKTIFHKLLEMK